ncbi:hypothetical protein L1049_028028 [Liquidambar formosana]|uniref:Uncharacterized protein n=1 Tax=Liquidambar formosana TaxID=63359 RepID=A0AAP0RJM4_LIQFO
MGTRITDLNFDVLKYIMLFVAQSGAENLARAVSVCRMFMELAMDKDALKAAVFDNVRLSGRYELFQQINGLISRSAHAGNMTAQYMLAKIILVSSSQLLEMESKAAYSNSSSKNHFSADQADESKVPNDDTLAVSKDGTLASSFMAEFTMNQSYNRKLSSRSLYHFELVKLFWRQCSPHDLSEMRLHFNRYFMYYVGSGGERDLIFFDFIKNMCILDDYLKAFEELEKLRNRLKDEVRVTGELEKENKEMNEELFGQNEGSNNAFVRNCQTLGGILVGLRNERREVDAEFEAVVHAQFDEFKNFSKKIAAVFEEHRVRVVPIFDNIFR